MCLNKKTFCLPGNRTSWYLNDMPNVLCLLTSQSSIAVDGHSLVPHCGASSSCLRAFMEELSQHGIAITYATTHGQDCSVFVEEEDSQWYFSNSAAFDRPKSLSECSLADFDGLLIPSSYGGLIDLVGSRLVEERKRISLATFTCMRILIASSVFSLFKPVSGKWALCCQSFSPKRCPCVWLERE